SAVCALEGRVTETHVGAAARPRTPSVSSTVKVAREVEAPCARAARNVSGRAANPRAPMPLVWRNRLRRIQLDRRTVRVRLVLMGAGYASWNRVSRKADWEAHVLPLLKGLGDPSKICTLYAFFLAAPRPSSVRSDMSIVN